MAKVSRRATRTQLNKAKIQERCKFIRTHFLFITCAELSKALGYKNAAEVSKMESGLVFNVDYLYRLAVYSGVSLDYIYGRSDFAFCETQTVERVALLHSLREFSDAYFSKFANALLSTVERDSLGLEIKRLFELSNELSVAWERLKENNKKAYLNLKGGLRVDSAISEIHNTATLAKQKSQKMKLDPKELDKQEREMEAVKNNHQMEFEYFNSKSF